MLMIILLLTVAVLVFGYDDAMSYAFKAFVLYGLALAALAFIVIIA